MISKSKVTYLAIFIVTLVLSAIISPFILIASIAMILPLLLRNQIYKFSASINSPKLASFAMSFGATKKDLLESNIAEDISELDIESLKEKLRALNFVNDDLFEDEDIKNIQDEIYQLVDMMMKDKLVLPDFDLDEGSQVHSAIRQYRQVNDTELYTTALNKNEETIEDKDLIIKYLLLCVPKGDYYEERLEYAYLLFYNNGENMTEEEKEKKDLLPKTPLELTAANYKQLITEINDIPGSAQFKVSKLPAALDGKQSRSAKKDSGANNKNPPLSP